MPDALRVVRAIATNQLARFVPSAYVRATRRTGRGTPESETADAERADLAEPFRNVCEADLLWLGFRLRFRRSG